MVAAANKLYPGRSNATKNRNVIVPMAAVLHYAAAQKRCPYQRFPAFWVSKKSNRRPADPRDVQRLLRVLDTPETVHKYILIAILFETGLRLEDCFDMQAPAGQGKPRIVKVKKTDSRIMPDLSDGLMARIAAAKRFKGEHLFNWTKRWSVYNWQRPLCRKLGIQWTPHLSRHALATDLQIAGIPDRQAADHGAWADVRSLHRYQHFAPVKLANRTSDALLQREMGGERGDVQEPGPAPAGKPK